MRDGELAGHASVSVWETPRWSMKTQGFAEGRS
jgi:hypothetical protein